MGEASQFTSFLRRRETPPAKILGVVGTMQGGGLVTSGLGSDELYFVLCARSLPHAGVRLPIALTGSITLARADTVTLTCGSSGPSGSVSYLGADIGAIQVAAVN